MIAAQAQRYRLDQLQHEVDFRLEELNAEQKMSEQAKLQSKLTFADIAVLDKATAPSRRLSPNPSSCGRSASAPGLALGLMLALIAEMTDRRVRFPIDLEYSAAAPFLGALDGAQHSRSRIGASGRGLRPA